MFTGLVETTGTVRAASGSSPRRLSIASSLPPGEITLGESISIDGCCLTVVANDSSGLAFEAATETLARTTLGDLKVGDTVNLERSLRLGDRLGGHLVAGHVDCVGVVRAKEQRQSAVYFGVEAAPEVLRLVAPRGSVTLAGVSLTVTGVDATKLWVGIIPHTLKVTTFGALQVGSRLNVEADLIARYVERLVGGGAAQPRGLTEEILRGKGFG